MARLLTKIGVLDLATGQHDAGAQSLRESYQLVSRDDHWLTPSRRIVSEAGSLLERADLAAALKIFFEAWLHTGDDPQIIHELTKGIPDLFETSSHLITEDYDTAWQHEGTLLLTAVT